MHAERRRRVFATCRRGTVAQANQRVAAGIGIVAAFLLAGGPSAAVAIAGPDGSHSDQSDNRDRSGSRGGSDWSDNNITDGIRGDQKSSTDDAPWTRVGSGRDAGTSDERSGPDYSPDRPGSAFKPPKVTFGDGRTPGVQDGAPEPRWRGGAPEPAPPPPPSTVVVDISPRIDRPPKPPISRQLIVAPAAGVSHPLFGLAGLLLIPVAGAVLGYRQARGAHAAAELGRNA
jgi:hypothetical protein